ncbi:MAG: 1-acyl-sn-glycerol-3-phosphate acyltransferase, partial [Tannerella sp.]|nr:1-acyl-sn-glycerol-3-phosphate acyltransferase [Tannerella sp.]
MKRFFYLMYFWLIVMPVFLVSTILTAVVVTVGCLLGGEKFFSFYPGMLWSRLTCLITLCPVTVRGREHLKPGQSYIFVANHQSAFDIFLIYGHLVYPVKWMMKVGLSKIPLVGTACRAAGFIFVEHSSPRAALRSIAEAERRLNSGASLVVFPEGSRTGTGKMSRFHKGAFQMALDRRLPIAPITLNGPFRVLPIGSINAHPHRLEMVIHPPISVDEQTIAEYGS